MEFQEAANRCHVKSAIFRESKPDVKYFNNDPIWPHNVMGDISEKDKKAKDWEEWDPRDCYDCSLPFD